MVLNKIYALINKAFSSVKAYATSGMVLVASGVVANFLNYAYNAFLTRAVSIEDFGLISLIGSFLFLLSIPLNALNRTVIHESAFYFGKYKKPFTTFWYETRKNIFLISGLFSVVWIVASPFLMNYFKTDSLLPILLFTPCIFIASLASIDTGFINGNLKFTAVGILITVEAICKLLVAYILVVTGYGEFAYLAIPTSLFVALSIAYLSVKFMVRKQTAQAKSDNIKFPTKFYTSSFVYNFSIIAFLSFDVLLAKHYLSPIEAGEYALVALVGKMIFSIGGLFSQFILPLVSKDEGSKVDSSNKFYTLFFISALCSFCVYIAVGLFGNHTAAFLFGDKISNVTELLPIYGFAVLLFSLASTIFGYYQIKDKSLFPITSFLLALVQIYVLGHFNTDLESFVILMAVLGFVNLSTALLLHLFNTHIEIALNNLVAFYGLFSPLPKPRKLNPDKLRILIYNWYDTKHVWGGGAEIYIHQVAKNFVKQGHDVTFFCGNDQQSEHYEEVDGVKVFRRGGIYTVAIWGFIYYVIKFRKNFDVVIDIPKGVPFFTPLFVTKPKICLVHQVHQEMFKKELPFPTKQLSMFLEGILMPFLYRKIKMLAVSDSTREEMLKIGLGKNQNIEIMYPGVEIKPAKVKKTSTPTVLYLGRLREYKGVDTAIHAIHKLKEKYTNIKLIIAGSGEHEKTLKAQVNQLGLQKHVVFKGNVTEKTKAQLFTKSWIAVQLSMVEGWGITVIEANMCETPVVATNVPGLKESVNHEKTGLLVEWANVDQTAEALDKLISDHELRTTFGKTGKLWANNFSWEMTANKFLHEIRKTLSIQTSNIEDSVWKLNLTDKVGNSNK